MTTLAGSPSISAIACGASPAWPAVRWKRTAERLAMSRVAMSRVLNGKAAISPDLAVRLEQAGASTARAWLAMQANYDLWCARQHEQPPVRRLQDAA